MMISLIATAIAPAVGKRLARATAWGIVLVVAALAVWVAIWWFTDTVDDARDAGVKQGVTTERVEAQAEVIKNVEKANETRAAVNDAGSCAAYRECLRSARNPANCVRYLPNDEGCPVQSGASSGQ